MSLKQDIAAFSVLGEFLNQFSTNGSKNDQLNDLNEEFYDYFLGIINRHIHHNGWFSKASIMESIGNISPFLTEMALTTWLNSYNLGDQYSNKKVLVIMPSNLPLVEFHDFISVLLTGHHFVGKCSQQNKHILPAISQILKAIDSSFNNRISFIEAPSKDFDAVIATGSNNSARYFEYYFSKLPNIIRKNRTSIAVLNGNESENELKDLANDITSYYGRGCRSVTKLYLPEGYNLDLIFNALYDKSHIVDNNKYGNNYDYHRALFLMGQHPFLDNGFAILKEDKSIHTPVSVIHYEYYSDIDSVVKEMDSLKEEIQCIVSNDSEISEIKFGQSQKPKWTDYADNIDTVDFLNNLY